jgi:hypothetical protein
MNIYLNKFKFKHKGEACYIIGDGPSIKSMDLSRFKDLPVLACGKLIFRNDFKELNCLYYTMPEPFLFTPNIFKRYEYLKQYTSIKNLILKKIIDHSSILFFLNATNILSVSQKNIYFIHRFLSNPIKHLSHRDPFAGSFIACLTLAYIMGFQKIFLVGFDSWTTKVSSNLRWFEKGDSSLILNDSHLSNELINFYKNTIDIKSILLDKDNALNFEGYTYQELFGVKPIYKENFELTSYDYLNILSTQSFYKIF